jgi:ribosomal protein S18 acetylase RimI-like enzyme
MDNNEKNLYDFYRLIGKGRYASLFEGTHYCAVSGKDEGWPQMIFDIQSGKNAVKRLELAFSDAAIPQDIRFGICPRKTFTASDQDLLRQGKIFPAGSWQLMEINSKDDIKMMKQDEHKIKRLINPATINDYVSLVNNNLMKGQVVKSELFLELVRQPGIEIYGQMEGNEVVSGLLTYSGTNNVTGLYFIATRQDLRGKGLAAGLIGSVVESLFARGIRKIVLQAMPKAVPLYARLGFLKTGELVIFWKQ